MKLEMQKRKLQATEMQKRKLQATRQKYKGTICNYTTSNYIPIK